MVKLSSPNFQCAHWPLSQKQFDMKGKSNCKKIYPYQFFLATLRLFITYYTYVLYVYGTINVSSSIEVSSSYSFAICLIFSAASDPFKDFEPYASSKLLPDECNDFCQIWLKPSLYSGQNDLSQISLTLSKGL